MKLSSLAKIAAIAATLLTGSAQASIVHYDMTFTGGVTASVTFDDTASTIGAGPFYGAGGSAYGLSSFIVNGASIGGGEAVIYNNWAGQADYLYFTDPLGYFFIQMGGLEGIFSSQALTQATGLTFADFGGAGNTANTLNYANGMTSFVAASVVPEPASLALLAMGLAGLAAARLRKSA